MRLNSSQIRSLLQEIKGERASERQTLIKARCAENDQDNPDMLERLLQECFNEIFAGYFGQYILAQDFFGKRLTKELNNLAPNLQGNEYEALIRDIVFSMAQDKGIYIHNTENENESDFLTFNNLDTLCDLIVVSNPSLMKPSRLKLSDIGTYDSIALMLFCIGIPNCYRKSPAKNGLEDINTIDWKSLAADCGYNDGTGHRMYQTFNRYQEMKPSSFSDELYKKTLDLLDEIRQNEYNGQPFKSFSSEAINLGITKLGSIKTKRQNSMQ